MSDTPAMSVTPDPADDEAAAIAAAVQAVLHAGPAVPAPAGEVSSWRFSGRWWSKPVSRRRSRPG